MRKEILRACEVLGNSLGTHLTLSTIFDIRTDNADNWRHEAKILLGKKVLIEESIVLPKNFKECTPESILIANLEGKILEAGIVKLSEMKESVKDLKLDEQVLKFREELLEANSKKLATMQLEQGNTYLLQARNSNHLNEVKILQKSETSYQFNFLSNQSKVWYLKTYVEQNYILIEILSTKVEEEELEKKKEYLKQQFIRNTYTKFPEGCIYNAEIEFLLSMIKELREKSPEIRHRDNGPIQFSYTDYELFINFTDNEELQYGYSLEAAKKMLVHLCNCIAGLQNKQKQKDLDSKFDVNTDVKSQIELQKEETIKKIKGYHVGYGVSMGWSIPDPSHEDRKRGIEGPGRWKDDKLQSASLWDLQNFLTVLESLNPRVL